MKFSKKTENICLDQNTRFKSFFSENVMQMIAATNSLSDHNRHICPIIFDNIVRPSGVVEAGGPSQWQIHLDF